MKATKEISKIVTPITTIRVMDDGIHCSRVCPFLRQRHDWPEKPACCTLTGTPIYLWAKDSNGLFRRLHSCMEAEDGNERNRKR